MKDCEFASEVDFMTELVWQLEWEQLCQVVREDLLVGGRLINTRDSLGATVLLTVVRSMTLSACEAAVETVRVLLAAGADPDMADEEGVTPLHWCVIVSAREGEPLLEVLQMLLRAGADVNRADKDGWTPLYSCVYYNCPQMIPPLLQAGARRDLRETIWGRTPLEYAEELGNTRLVELLRE